MASYFRLSARQWLDLIFGHCDTTTLLALRLVCVGLFSMLDHADAKRLWDRYHMCVPRMTHAERVLGWLGVRRGMERERVTRENAAAGRFETGAVVDIPYETQYVLVVCGRLLFATHERLFLADMDTGAVLASYPLGRGVSTGLEAVVYDRWVPFVGDGFRVMLLDCATASVVEVLGIGLKQQRVTFSASGPLISIAAHGEDSVTLVSVDTHKVETVDVDELLLCNRGESYVVISNTREARLVDRRTGVTRWTVCWPDGNDIQAGYVDDMEGYLYVARWRNPGKCTKVFRLDTGQLVARASLAKDVLLCTANTCRLLSPGIFMRNAIAMDGNRITRTVVEPVVDMSGSIAWRDNNTILVSGGPCGTPHEVMDGRGLHTAQFQRGVLVTIAPSTRKLHAFRFDHHAPSVESVQKKLKHVE